MNIILFNLHANFVKSGYKSLETSLVLWVFLALGHRVRAGNLDLVLRSVSSPLFHVVIRCGDSPSSQGC